MRSIMIVAAIILAACTVPPSEQKPIPVSPAIDVTAPRETEAPKAKEHKPQPPKSAPVPHPHPCVGIDTGDLKSDVKAKLECLEEHG